MVLASTLSAHAQTPCICGNRQVYKLNANVHDGITSVIVLKGHKLAIFLIFAKNIIP